MLAQGNSLVPAVLELFFTPLMAYLLKKHTLVPASDKPLRRNLAPLAPVSPTQGILMS